MCDSQPGHWGAGRPAAPEVKNWMEFCFGVSYLSSKRGIQEGPVMRGCLGPRVCDVHVG